MTESDFLMMLAITSLVVAGAIGLSLALEAFKRILVKQANRNRTSADAAVVKEIER